MAFDSAVPVDGMEEKSMVVTPADDSKRRQKAMKDHLGNSIQKPGIDPENTLEVKPGEVLEDDQFTQK